MQNTFHFNDIFFCYKTENSEKNNIEQFAKLLSFLRFLQPIISPARSGSPRKRPKKKGKTLSLRKKLRETVLEEGDDWRQTLRQTEEKNRALQDKLQVRTQFINLTTF